MRVKGVRFIGDYSLALTFWNGEERQVDLSPYVGEGEIFSPLKNPDYFKQVRIDDSQLTICWPNGADFCPDVLWEISKTVKKAA